MTLFTHVQPEPQQQQRSVGCTGYIRNRLAARLQQLHNHISLNEKALPLRACVRACVRLCERRLWGRQRPVRETEEEEEQPVENTAFISPVNHIHTRLEVAPLSLGFVYP